MDDSSTYAHHLARLVSCLLREPSDIASQMAALRGIAGVAKAGPITIERSNAGITVNGAASDPAVDGTDLAAQLSVHGLRGILCAAGASVDELLGVARILVAAPSGASAMSRLQAIHPKSVRFLTSAAPVMSAPPAPAQQPSRPAAPAPRRPTPAAPRQPTAAAPTAPANARRPAAAAAPPRRPTPTSVTKPPPRRPTPISVTDPPPPRRPTPIIATDRLPPRRPTPIAPPSGLMQQDGSALWELFSSNAPEGTAEELFAQLDSLTAPNVDRVTKLLSDLVAVAENAAREQKPLLVGDVMRGIVRREPAVHDVETRRAFGLAIRRASQPLVLRCIAHLLPHRPEHRDEHARVLLRAGDDGADALLERLAEAHKAEDRRIYIDVVLWLRANAPALIRDAALIHMLGDDRWFVARTAAELLGEMRVTAAEELLTALLRHEDERIRRSAAVALMQLGTESGRKAIEDALADPSPDVRILAVSAMATTCGDDRAATAATLLRALDEEEDSDVQLALLAALGRLATPAAVERLSQAAEPEGRFFKKKTLEFRLAAVQALGEARGAAALSALNALESDREREICDAVARAQIHARRSS